MKEKRRRPTQRDDQEGDDPIHVLESVELSPRTVNFGLNIETSEQRYVV